MKPFASGSKMVAGRCLVLFALVALALCAAAYAATRGIPILFNGAELAERGVMVGEQVYVPLAAVREISGADVSWDPARQIVKIVTPGQRASGPDVLFADDFDHGMRPEWRTSPLGSWTPANGDLVPTEAGGDNRTFAFVGDASWQDYCIDVDIRVESWNVWPASGMALLCRARGESNYVAFVIDPSMASGYWQVARGGKTSDPIQKVALNLHAGASLHLRLVARGQQVAIFMNGMPDPLATYGSAGRNGGVGLMSWMLAMRTDRSVVDNFRVMRLPSGAEPPSYPRFKKWPQPER